VKIGINATCYDDRPTGATQRFKGVYRELFKRLRNTEFVVFEPHDCNISAWFDNYENLSFRPTPFSSRRRTRKLLRGLSFWPNILRRERCDVFEAFNLPLISSPKSRTLLTIQDIRYISHPRSSLEGYISRLVLDRAVAKCDLIITVSFSMRDEILALYPTVPISVVHNGVDIDCVQVISSADLSTVRHSYNLPNDFVLSVGHLEPRKNYRNLVTAIARLRESRRDVHLVIVGNDHGDLPAVQRHIHSLGVALDITILNGLSDFEVSCMYRLCRLFVFPSSYEGFGIPILEAMLARCPMVLSDIAVFKEITQGRGAYFKHDEPDSIAAAIDGVITSNGECERLVQYGIERVKDFTFVKVSRVLEEVYRSLA
jgi:glycosyltransferase involved in cell wall biosynthesis